MWSNDTECFFCLVLPLKFLCTKSCSKMKHPVIENGSFLSGEIRGILFPRTEHKRNCLTSNNDPIPQLQKP